MMPGGDAEAYKYLAPIVEKVAAQTEDGACVTYIGPGGSGKLLYNRICVLILNMQPFSLLLCSATSIFKLIMCSEISLVIFFFVILQATLSRWFTTVLSTETCSSFLRRMMSSRPSVA